MRKSEYRIKSQAIISALDLHRPFLSEQQAQEVYSLTLRHAGPEDIHALGIFKNLRSLTIRQSALSDICFVQQFGELRSLDLCENKIEDISPLAGLENLYSLRLSHNCIKDANVATFLPALNTLDLSGNKLRTLPDLSAASRLSILNVRNNRVGALYFPGAPASLHSLLADDNEIADINGLRILRGLCYLHAAGNYIRDINCLFDLPDLTFAALEDNFVSQNDQARLALTLLLKTVQPTPVDTEEYSTCKNEFMQKNAAHLPHSCLLLLADLIFIRRLTYEVRRDTQRYQARCDYDTTQNKNAYAALHGFANGWAKSRILRWAHASVPVKVPLRIDQEEGRTPPRKRGGLIFYMTEGGIFGGDEVYTIDRSEYADLDPFG